jgi:hypothetical protein
MSSMDKAEIENVPHVKTPISDITISEAATLADDGDQHYLFTMAAVLATFSISVEAYWDLTVIEHQMLVDWLIETHVLVSKEAD